MEIAVGVGEKRVGDWEQHMRGSWWEKGECAATTATTGKLNFTVGLGGLKLLFSFIHVPWQVWLCPINIHTWVGTKDVNLHMLNPLSGTFQFCLTWFLSWVWLHLNLYIHMKSCLVHYANLLLTTEVIDCRCHRPMTVVPSFCFMPLKQQWKLVRQILDCSTFAFFYLGFF